MSQDDPNNRALLPDVLVPMQPTENVAFFWKHNTRQEYEWAWFLASWLPYGGAH